MTQKERRVFLINYLKNEEESFKGIVIPHGTKTSPSRFDERASAHACLKGFYGHTGRIFTTGEQAAWDCIPW